jgi:hypothetical protein
MGDGDSGVKKLKTSSDRLLAREVLLAAAARWMASDHHFNASQPGPNDDAEMEYRDEGLIVAARKFVEAHEGVVTVFDG